jgi:hypothetical protein
MPPSSGSKDKLNKPPAWQKMASKDLFHPGFLLRLLFWPEDGEDMFLRNVGCLSTDYMQLDPRRCNSLSPPACVCVCVFMRETRVLHCRRSLCLALPGNISAGFIGRCYMQGVSKRAFQWYSKCYCVARNYQSFKRWIVCTPLSVNFFVTFDTQ